MLTVIDAMLEGRTPLAVRIPSAPDLGILRVVKVSSHKKFGTIVIVETSPYWPSTHAQFDADECIVVAY